MNEIDWCSDPEADNDEEAVALFNDTFESDCYDDQPTGSND